MAMQSKTWITTILFDKWISHFISYVQAHERNLCLINWHLLVLDGHNSHVTIDVVHKAMGVGFDLIILPSHTSHTLQPLDVTCFKPFKTKFRAYKNVWILVNKKNGATKNDLVQCISLVLKRTLTPQNICKGFKTTRIWLFDPNVMASKMQPNEQFVETNMISTYIIDLQVEKILGDALLPLDPMLAIIMLMLKGDMMKCKRLTTFKCLMMNDQQRTMMRHEHH